MYTHTVNSALNLFILSMTSFYFFNLLQHMFAIITNIISIFVAIFGLILLGYEFPIFESIGTEYIWSNVSTNFNNNSIIVLDRIEKNITNGTQ